MFVALRFCSCISRSVSPNVVFALAFRGAFRQTSVLLLHFAEMFAKRWFVSCISRSISPNVEVSPASCLGLSPLGEDLLQSAGDVRSPTKYLLQSAGDVRTPTKYLLQPAGDVRSPTKYPLQLAGDVRSPTMISCNLREIFVPLRILAMNPARLYLCVIIIPI